MIHFFGYLITSTVCLSICYGIYLFLFRKETGFIYLRTFLLDSIVISLLLPLAPFSIETGILSRDTRGSESLTANRNSDYETIEAPSVQNDVRVVRETSEPEFTHLLNVVYFIGLIIVLVWILLQLYQITRLIIESQIRKSNGIHFATNKKVQAPFSFFTWIFLPHALKDTEEGKIITCHEKVHVTELHSLDILIVNLLCAFMWFNPLIWRLRYSMQQLHEYLADEGALISGIDRNVYMSLMLDQAAEKRQLPLYSGFNRSLLKNRITMMSKKETYKRNNYKIVALVPLSIFLLFSVACVNGSKESNEGKGTTGGDRENVTLAVETVKMNVVYCGVNNPVIIAANGIDMRNIGVEIDNGKIVKNGEEYIINPARTGHAKVDILKDGVKIGSKDFRVLSVPDPQPYLVLNGGNTGSGEVRDAEELANAKGIIAELPDFLFDVDFKIIGFEMNAVVNGSAVTEVSGSGTISDRQRDLIKRLKPGQVLIISEIKAIGPDGATRLLHPLEIKIL